MCLIFSDQLIKMFGEFVVLESGEKETVTSLRHLFLIKGIFT